MKTSKYGLPGLIAALLLAACGPRPAEPTPASAPQQATPEEAEGAPAESEGDTVLESQPFIRPTPEGGATLESELFIIPGGGEDVVTVGEGAGQDSQAAPGSDTSAEVVAAPQPSAPVDRSGLQDALSAEEEAAASAPGYSGVRCRVTTNLQCSCINDSIASAITFPDPNQATWSLTLSDGASVTYNLARAGVNTWEGSTSSAEGITLDLLVVFFAGGLEQTVTLTLPEGGTATCTNVWRG